MVKYKLYYFNAYGKTEGIRLLFAYGDLEYEDSRFEMDKWPEIKPKMPFQKVPVLEVDGKMISQSGAIYRLIAKTVGLYGNDDMECAEIDMILDTCDEIFQFIGPNLFGEKDPERKAAAIKRCSEELMPSYLDYFEKCLQETDGYFVGGRMTVADIRIAQDILWPRTLGIAVTLDNHPKLKALEKKVNSHPKIAAWIAKRPVTGF